MYYSNMRCRTVMLGDKVKTSHHINASHYMVKKIDTAQDIVYIIDLENKELGQWYSANALFLIVQ